MLTKKVQISLRYELNPIFLVQDQEEIIPQGVKIIAYEPVFAIGSGNPDTPENADAVAGSNQSKNSNTQILYGGSVNRGKC